MLVDKQGNFGSIAGLPAAAMRYTEARLSPIAAQMLDDINLDTVDLESGDDGQLTVDVAETETELVVIATMAGTPKELFAFVATISLFDSNNSIIF